MLQRITQVFGLGGEETGRPAASVKLHAEWLEARAVPASVTLSSGVVVIRGDEVADEFRIDVDRGNVSVSQARGGVFREVARYSGSRVGSVVYYGYGGNDRLANNTNLPLTAYGGSGDDVIVGGSGVDYLYGDQGVDWLYGGGGGDWIYGGTERDALYGNEGNDHIYGQNGDDDLWGGTGDDTLQGEAGADRLMGEWDNDYLNGGADNDELYGHDGQDILIGSSGFDYMDGGSGYDVAYYDDVREWWYGFILNAEEKRYGFYSVQPAEWGLYFFLCQGVGARRLQSVRGSRG